MAGLFPDDAVIRRVGGESILLLGGGRALLMQLAHPQVAAGVADHSGFESDPFGRLRRTLDATYTMVFGTPEQARAAAAGINAVHRRVTGPGYRASDPELLLWVHATLVDTALRVLGRFLRPLADSRQPDLQEEELVEREPAARPLGLLGSAGAVQGDERVEAEWQPLARPQRCGKRVAEVPCVRQRALDQRPQTRGRHLLARGVHGRKVRGRGRAVQVVRADVELAPALRFPDRRQWELWASGDRKMCGAFAHERRQASCYPSDLPYISAR